MRLVNQLVVYWLHQGCGHTHERNIPNPHLYICWLFAPFLNAQMKTLHPNQINPMQVQVAHEIVEEIPTMKVRCSYTVIASTVHTVYHNLWWKSSGNNFIAISL